MKTGYNLIRLPFVVLIQIINAVIYHFTPYALNFNGIFADRGSVLFRIKVIPCRLTAVIFKCRNTPFLIGNSSVRKLLISCKRFCCWKFIHFTWYRKIFIRADSKISTHKTHSVIFMRKWNIHTVYIAYNTAANQSKCCLIGWIFPVLFCNNLLFTGFIISVKLL